MNSVGLKRLQGQINIEFQFKKINVQLILIDKKMNEFYGTNFPLYFFISDFVHIPFLLRKRSLNLLQEKKEMYL